MHKPFQRALVVIGALGVIGFALPAFVSATGHAGTGKSAPASSSAQPKPHNVTCHTNDILTGFFGNVTVAKDNVCELLQAIVEGNVTANSPGQWAIGDTSWCTSSLDQVTGNLIVGDLNFTNNKSGASISNNDIEDDLNCTGNAPPPTGTNNRVDGPNTGQCSTTGGGTDDDTTSPGDND